LPALIPRAVVLAPLLALSWLTPSLAAADTADQCATTAEGAQALVKAHRWVAARRSLVVCAADSCPIVVRRDCVQWLAQLDARMPSVVVRGRDSRGHDVIGVRVIVDGTLVLQRLDGVTLPLDPGRHHFRFEVRGAAPIDEDLLLAEGEHDRLVTAGFLAPLTADGEADAAPGDGRDADVRSSRPASAYVFGGAGLALLGAFAILDATTYSEYESQSNGCGKTQSCSASEVSSLRTRFTLAAVALGVGVVSVGIGSWLFFTATPRQAGATVGLGTRF